MSNTPSNKDIDLLVRAYLGDCGPQANRVYSFVTAVLAKWGTPQPVVREPLSVQEVEQLLAQWSYEVHGDRARYLVRMTEAAHSITQKGGSNAE